MADLIIVLILLALIGAAVRYIVKAKKNGVKCIGCPDGAACSRRQAGSCGGCEAGGCGGCSASDDFEIKK